MRTPPSLLALVIVAFVAGSSSAAETTEGSTEGNATTTKSPLTGDPQKDYIYDPNLPFQLKGYNLSDYPFYVSMPTNITFKCDGLKDGFYASIPHKCQVYHQCLFGVRYDFLCANYTAFDQQNFICHFASEVDCDNSEKYFNRNDALYKPTSTTTTTTAGPPERVRAKIADRPNRRQRPLRRRPFRRRRPVYDDYYYDDYYSYDEYDNYYDYDYGEKGRRKGGRRRPGSEVQPVVERDPSDPSRKGLFSRPRPAPLIKPPVPVNAKPTEPPSTTIKSTPINLNNIPFDDAPIPINENLVRDSEYDQTSPEYQNDYFGRSPPSRKTRPTETTPPKQSQGYRRYPGRHGVRTTTSTEPPTPAPTLPPVEEKQFIEYEEYPEYAPKRPLRRNPSYRQRRPGGYRRRRPYRQRTRLRQQEENYPDTEGAASFTKVDAPVQRVRSSQRHRESLRYDEPTRYENEPEYPEVEIPEPRVPERRREEDISPRRKSPFVIPPRRLQSRPLEKSPPSPTSPRERFPSRRPSPTEEPIIEEEIPVQYEEAPIAEEPSIPRPLQTPAVEPSRPLYSRPRSRYQEQQPPVQETEIEESDRFYRNNRNFEPENNRDVRRGGHTSVQALTKAPAHKKKGTPIRIEDIVFEEIPIGHPVANVRPGTFPLSPKRPVSNPPVVKEVDVLDEMPVDELGKFTPAINKRPTKIRLTPVKLQSDFRQPPGRSRDRRPFQDIQEQPVREAPRGSFSRNNNRPQEYFEDIMDRPAPQVPRSRSQFPEASIFQNPVAKNSQTRLPENMQPPQSSSFTEPVKNQRPQTRREGGHFRFRIPVRASRRLVQVLPEVFPPEKEASSGRYTVKFRIRNINLKN